MNSVVNHSERAPRPTGRPVIGICARTAPVTLQGTAMTASLVLQSHVAYVAAAGGDPVLLPLLSGAEHLLGLVDGLLIPGGPDLDPALYRAAAHPRTRVTDPAADRAELGLLGAALGAGLPVLAICRGMQLLNVFFGGTLHQHLPDLLGDDCHSPERQPYTLGRHPLELTPGSRVAEILGGATAPESACHHHQSVDRIGAGLTATAWAQDGTVEAVEALHHSFVVGVQWEAGQTDDERFHAALVQAAVSRGPIFGKSPEVAK